MAINQVSLSNTFGQLVTTTSALISTANLLTDGPQLNANTLLYLTAAGVSLNVVNTAIIGTANITILNTPYINVVTLKATSANITSSNTGTANIALMTGAAVNQFDANGAAVMMALALG